MSLFEVEGWNLKQDRVAFDKGENKKRSSKSKKDPKVEYALRNGSVHDIVENNDSLKAERKRKKKDEHFTKVERSKKQKKETHDQFEEKSTEDNNVEQRMEFKKEENIGNELPLSVSANSKLTKLQQKMMSKLSGSRFRWINEKLYTTTSEDALKLIMEQPSLFDEYHKGFKAQVESWPENPVDVFVSQIKKRGLERPVNAPGGLPGHYDKKVVIADMGCGEAQLASDVSDFVKKINKKQSNGHNKKTAKRGKGKNLDIEVRSFDLKKANERVEVADIKNIPMKNESCNIVVFCLALMGTNFLDFIKEAHRLLAPKGELWVAEIKSRFTESTNGKHVKEEDIGHEFAEALKLNGFFHKSTDNSNKMFSRFEFFKPSKEIMDERKAKLERKKKFIEQETEKDKFNAKRSEKPEGEWLLKPCIYKRR